MPHEPLRNAISRHIWETKYRFRDATTLYDVTVDDTWRRVARAVAAAEPRDHERWERDFHTLLQDFRFLPGGRILAGAGTARRVTLFNCFVMGTLRDSMDGIFDGLKEGAITMQQGGGVGYDFSTLRPRGTAAHSVGSIASGPVSFMRIWDAMCATLLSTGARRGAMMATLRCDHPDIEWFVTAKHDPSELRHFNLSVLISDAFMEAVKNDAQWALVFPCDGVESGAGEGETVELRWPGRDGLTPCRVYRRVAARELWNLIMRATYDYAEPGVLFIDRINHENNLTYRETISATNPCGEVPLPPYGACNLGSVNLTRFVQSPLTTAARFDFAGMSDVAATAVRFMDDVIDVSRFPLPQQEEQARGTRRIGLGVTGLADALILLGMRYGSERSLDFAAEVMRTLRDVAYRTSMELAREKGAFPFFDATRYLASTFVANLPQELRAGIARYGIRNSHLLAVAPTGTISILANNVSSSLEPVFNFAYTRKVLEADGGRRAYELNDYAWQMWRERGSPDDWPQDVFVTAAELDPHVHLALQAALQPFVDNAISKTINVPADYPFERFRDLYEHAFALGLKGCTTFRPNAVTGTVLAPVDEGVDASHCCTIEREEA